MRSVTSRPRRSDYRSRAGQPGGSMQGSRARARDLSRGQYEVNSVKQIENLLRGGAKRRKN